MHSFFSSLPWEQQISRAIIKKNVYSIYMVSSSNHFSYSKNVTKTQKIWIEAGYWVIKKRKKDYCWQILLSMVLVPTQPHQQNSLVPPPPWVTRLHCSAAFNSASKTVLFNLVSLWFKCKLWYKYRAVWILLMLIFTLICTQIYQIHLQALVSLYIHNIFRIIIDPSK